MSDDNVRVLVVDDERFFREAIRDILTGAGIDCLEVADGELAVEEAHDPAIGVVVLDIRLPGIDGIEVLRRLRALRPELRVIMLSASTDQELVLDALRLGAADYLAKPLHDEELLLAVRRAKDGYAVSHDWSQLRGRLDRLVAGTEKLAAEIGAECGPARDATLQRGAVALAAEVLEADKTSLMLLDAGGSELRVVAAVGRDLPAEEMDAVAVGEGVAGLALSRAEPLVVDMVAGDERFADRAPDGRYQSGAFAVAPLVEGERNLGVLCATDRRGGLAFSHEDLSLMRLLAMQVATLLASDSASESPAEVSQSESEQAEALDDAELARLVCDAVVSEIEPVRVIRAALRPLAAGLAARPVSLYLMDDSGTELRLEGEWDDGMRSDRAALPVERGLTGTVLQTGHLVAAPAPDSDPRFDPEVDTPEDGRVGPLLCLPIRLRGKVVGVARAFPAEAEVSARTGEVLTAVLSAAVRNVLLYRSLVDSIEEVAAVRRQAGAEGGRPAAA